MARRPTPIGVCGSISVRQIGPRRWEARTRFRRKDGSYPQVGRIGSTKAGAVELLKVALLTLINEVRGAQINPDTRFKQVGALWLAEITRDSALGGLADGTVQNYGRWLKNWILPDIGELRMRELSVLGCEDVVDRAHDAKGFTTSSKVKVVLGLVCGYAVRHRALEANPVRSMKRLTRGDSEEKEVRGLTGAERKDLFAKLALFVATKSHDAKGRSLGARAKAWADLPDLAHAFLATGGRLGEMLALYPEDVDTAAMTVALDHHVVRVKGGGLVRKAKRKGNKGGLLLQIPAWSKPMWLRRRLAAAAGGPLFADAGGGLLDPTNVPNRLRTAFDACGYGWLTSHGFRKTVAAVIDEADLPLSAIADQLGNTPGVAEKHYRQRRVANTQQAAALETMFDDEPGEAESK